MDPSLVMSSRVVPILKVRVCPNTQHNIIILGLSLADLDYLSRNYYDIKLELLWTVQLFNYTR